MSTSWFCKNIYLEDTWHENTRVLLDDAGRISHIEHRCAAQEQDQLLDGWVLPGVPNAHSHAFQYAMAGLVETAGTKQETFWTWRDRMYKLALALSPDQIGVIAESLYCDLLRHGYTSVAEFHYLHHAPDGSRYADPAEIGKQLFAAATRAGIHLTLIPVYYERANFDKESALSEQRRFTFKSVDEYANIVSLLAKAGATGSGVHSVRAASPTSIRAIANLNRAPFHIHVAEQQKEVNDCQLATGKRPVQLLADTIELSERVFLVHATHIDNSEMAAITSSKAAVVLCPSTEGNLGDGVFPFATFLADGGRFCIGSDSHIGLHPFEELRWLDYQQRLSAGSRSPLGAPLPETAEWLFQQAVKFGAMSTGQKCSFEVGSDFNVIEIDPTTPAFCHKPKQKIIPTLLYHSSSHHIRRVITAGKVRVENGLHQNEHNVRRTYAHAMRDVLAEL